MCQVYVDKAYILYEHGFKQKPLTINHRLTMPVVYEFNKAVVSLFN